MGKGNKPSGGKKDKLKMKKKASKSKASTYTKTFNLGM